MAEFFKQIEIILIDMWIYLYCFVCHLHGDIEVEEDWLVSSPAEEK